MKSFSKRLTATILIMAMMVSMLGIVVSASPGMHFTIGTVTGEPGDTVEIDVTMSGNPGFSSATIEFSLGAGLSFVGTLANYDLSNSAMPGPLFNPANGRMNFGMANPLQNFTGNGHVITLVIAIDPSATPGQIPVSINAATAQMSIFNAANVEVPFTVTAGSVTVDAPFSGTPATVRVEPGADPFFDVSSITAEAEAANITVVIDSAPPAGDFDTAEFNEASAVFASITLEDNIGATIPTPFGFRVAVTMPIPPGVSAGDLRVFHYGSNPAGSPTTITPTISGSSFTFMMSSNEYYAFGALSGTFSNTGSQSGDVLARVIGLDEDPAAFAVEIEWGDMLFVFDHGGHTDVLSTNVTVHGTLTTVGLTTSVNNSPHWRPEFINGINNRIGVKNVSADSTPLDVTFNYIMEPGSGGAPSQFNAAAGVNNVVGRFHSTNAAALTAAGVLTNPTAINSAASPNLAYGDSDSVYFAFSGTPDGAPGDGSWPNFRLVGRVVVSWEPA